IVNVSVTEDMNFAVGSYEQADEDFLSNRVLAFAILTVDCTDDNKAHDPQARIGGLDCAQRTLDVTLDNSRSEDQTIYLVTAISLADGDQFYEEAFTVPSGDVQNVSISVRENSTVGVIAGDKELLEDDSQDEGELARELFRVDCTPGDEPRAGIGEVNCTNVTVPLILDNTSSPVATTFNIIAYAEEGDEFFEYDEYFDVPAGEERTVAVPVPDHAEIVVTASDGDTFYLGDALAYELVDVDCVRVRASRAGPRLAVGNAALAATGASGLALPIAGLTLLACGGVLSLLGRRHS
ncbi:MAG: hypothetical protein WAL70_12170, partial [Aeromicrobium sp.]